MTVVEDLLVLGDFVLTGGTGGDPEAPWTVEIIGEDMDFGDAEPREVIVRTLLQDGDGVTIDGHGNREVVLGALITAERSDGLAGGEAALMAELGRRNTLTWTPPDSYGPPTVHEVITSTHSFEFDDWGEMEPEQTGRRFVLRFICEPFPRSVEETVVEAISTGATPPAPTPVVVDDGTSTSGWAASYDVRNSGFTTYPAGVESGAVVARTAVPAAVKTLGGNISATLARTGLNAPMGDTPYLEIDVSVVAIRFPQRRLAFEINGRTAYPVAVNGTWFTFKPGVATVTSVKVTTHHSALNMGGSMFGRIDLAIAEIKRTNVPPIIGTGRQQHRSLQVEGTARTQGSLQIAHNSAGLGTVMAYTCPDDGTGYQPPLTAHRVAGTPTTTDTSTASGIRRTLAPLMPELFEVPARAVPSGTYSVMAILRSATAGEKEIFFGAETVVGGQPSGGAGGSRVVTLPANAWTVVELGVLPLPPAALPASSAADVRVWVTASEDDAVVLDEVYIFNLDVGALTWVNAGSARRMWLDTATLDWPRPAIWLGSSADRSDARHAVGKTEIRSMGTHMFPPGGVNVFTVALGAPYASASLRFHRRWHANAAA
ncbi:hypothetical protein [Nocardioides ochotonae]|uniref:hypothetical protein n=1 Tax=Nocardioides ochotonae TaxID=2685869 RepID=UPI00140AD049|nr:hypothetical protein [Nocardioides ochotonae]